MSRKIIRTVCLDQEVDEAIKRNFDRTFSRWLNEQLRDIFKIKKEKKEELTLPNIE